MKRDFLTLWDISPEELEQLMERALSMKAGRERTTAPLTGKSIGLLFEKPSTRTRVSFEVGIYQLGGQAVCMSPADLQLGRGETIPDTARTLSRYLSAVVIRTSAHDRLEAFAQEASIPVINGLSDTHHPCQALADLMTIREKKGQLKGLKVAFVGDGNNVCNSLIEAASRMQFSLAIACPEGFDPAPDILARARASSRSEIAVMRDPMAAAAAADVIYTDVWVSMGQEQSAAEKKASFKNYQINHNLLTNAKNDVIVLHCLPAHRGEEITDDVLDGPHSAVFDQAENRLHAQKALLEMLVT
ncbi:MAG: ornithine carbamoyltransferase [Thermodesulfovibrio sp.]|nr:ornithine carbamoyltransferase [Thermodesulfovibrio sp.]